MDHLASRWSLTQQPDMSPRSQRRQACPQDRCKIHAADNKNYEISAQNFLARRPWVAKAVPPRDLLQKDFVSREQNLLSEAEQFCARWLLTALRALIGMRRGMWRSCSMIVVVVVVEEEVVVLVQDAIDIVRSWA